MATHARGQILRRPELEARFAEGLGRRLTLVIADAGYGKSTLLGTPVEGRLTARHTVQPADRQALRLASSIADAFRAAGIEVAPLPVVGSFASDETSSHELLASWIAQGLGSVTGDVALILDDLHELPAGTGGARLVEALVRQAPGGLHFAIGSREEPPFPMQRLRGRGEVIELTAADLAFRPAEIGRLVEMTLGSVDPAVGAGLAAATGGWPAAVRLAVESLRPVAADGLAKAANELARSPGSIVDYLAEEVVAHQSTEIRDLLGVAAMLDWFTAGMLRSVGIREPGRLMADLERRGLLVRLGPERSTLHQLIGAVVRQRLVLSIGRRRAVVRRAVDWLLAEGEDDAAIRLAAGVGEGDRLERLLLDHGEALIARGQGELVLDAAAQLPVDVADRGVAELVGQAHAARGEWEAARAAYERTAPEQGAGHDGPRLPARLAWRLAAVEWERGRFADAAELLERANIEEAAPRDGALALATLAPILWNAGDAERARAVAVRASELASTARDGRASAAAHLAMAMTDPGQPLEDRLEHLRRALAHTEAENDVAQAVRVRVNLATLLGPAEGLRTITPAVALAEALGSAVRLGTVLNNRGEDLLGLGRYEEAAADLRRAAALLEGVGSARAGWARMNRGDVARETGDIGLARTLYADALRRGEAAGDAQSEIGALAGLARVTAREDPRGAAGLAARAVDRARPLGVHIARALLSAGWVAVLEGRTDDARSISGEAIDAARHQGWPPDAAEAMELHAASAVDEAERRTWLEAAAGEWSEIGNVPARLRVELALAWLDGDQAEVRRAKRLLQRAGIRDRAAAAAGLLATLPTESTAAIEIRTLGGFELLRDGQHVPVRAWRSRKARDLLKILVAKRGRPMARDELAVMLWPDDELAMLAPRLSVTASLLRRVLQPAGWAGEDEILGADRQHLWLRADRAMVDVEEFMAEAGRGLLSADEASAHASLETSERLYAGEFLEDEPYADWAVALREEARTTYVSVARRLAEIAERRGEHDRAIQYFLRILERDPFDEPAHLRLVSALEAAGRHGEARRAFRMYVRRMEEIGIEPAAYPTDTT